MRKLFATLFSVVLSLMIICPSNILLAEEELTYGPGVGYSNWTTERTGEPGEQTKIFYQYRDVSSWNSSLVQSTAYPTFYKAVTYATGTYVCGSYRGKYHCSVHDFDGCSGTTCSNASSSWYCCCGYPIEYNYCTSYATGYYNPGSWSNWSAWSTSSVSQTTSREVRSKTFYSHKLKYNISYDLDGGVEKIPNPTKYTYGDQITLNEPIKVDYNFKGWNPTGVITSSDTGDKHFKAIWEKAVLSYSGSTFKKGDKASENALVPNSYYSDDYNYKYTPATNACEE